MEIAVSAPGRVDLFNTHQDYKGLPVVPAAVGLRTLVSGEPSDWRRLTVYSARVFPYAAARVRQGAKIGMGEAWKEFDIDEAEFTGEWSDYVKACVRVLIGHGYKIRGGSLEIKSAIPVASGLASSAALEVSTGGSATPTDLGYRGRR